MRVGLAITTSVLTIIAIFVATCALRLHAQVSQLCTAGNLGEEFCTGAQLREAIFGGLALSSAVIACALLTIS